MRRASSPRLSRLLSLCVCASAASAPAPPPNIILYVPDEMRAESMRLYGGPAATPAFERLAADGTTFTQAFTTYPVCTQSRAAFLTGRFTHAGGHRSLWNPLRWHEPNLLRYAKNASYEVLMYGKNDALDAASFPSSATRAGDAGGAGESAGLLYPADDPRHYSFIGARPGWPPAESGDRANVARALADLAARNASSPPFFLFLPLTAPHPPYGCPGDFYDAYNSTPVQLRPPGGAGELGLRARQRFYHNQSRWPAGTLEQAHRLYLGCISFADDVFGTLLRGLDELGLYNDTAVM